MQKTALVCGGHGFIGHHMARRLKKEGYWVRTADIKKFPYGDLDKEVDDYVVEDLRDFDVCKKVFVAPEGSGFDEIYQFAAFMGGAGIVFTGNYDARIIHDSMLLNINSAEMAKRTHAGKIFWSSSACIYNQNNLITTDNPITAEESAYPAFPDSDYGFEKLMSERLYQAYARNYRLNVRIARFHNICGVEGAWGNGREKFPAAVSRKIAMANNGDTIEIWGDGEQTRSFLYVDECIEGIRRLMASDFQGPVNIGSDEMVSINNLVEMTKDIAGKPDIKINHVPGPVGIRGRNSDNRLIKEKLSWAPNCPLQKAMEKIYPWVEQQVKENKQDYSWTS
jgi:nucleoside-diphosphate-sugar epimerase